MVKITKRKLENDNEDKEIIEVPEKLESRQKPAKPNVVITKGLG